MNKNKQPPCCQTCPHITRDGRCLSNDKRCTEWRAWFRKEWAAIQAAAGIVKAPPEEAPKAKHQEETPKTIEKRPTVCLPR